MPEVTSNRSLTCQVSKSSIATEAAGTTVPPTSVNRPIAPNHSRCTHGKEQAMNPTDRHQDRDQVLRRLPQKISFPEIDNWPPHSPRVSQPCPSHAAEAERSAGVLGAVSKNLQRLNSLLIRRRSLPA